MVHSLEILAVITYLRIYLQVFFLWFLPMWLTKYMEVYRIYNNLHISSADIALCPKAQNFPILFHTVPIKKRGGKYDVVTIECNELHSIFLLLPLCLGIAENSVPPLTILHIG